MPKRKTAPVPTDAMLELAREAWMAGARAAACERLKEAKLAELAGLMTAAGLQRFDHDVNGQPIEAVIDSTITQRVDPVELAKRVPADALLTVATVSKDAVKAVWGEAMVLACLYTHTAAESLKVRRRKA